MLCVLFFGLLTPGAPGADVASDPGIGDRIRPVVDRAMAVGATPGLQVAVVFRDGRMWTGAFGLADVDSAQPVTDDTRFYLASTTKALTALAGARLHERGVVDLDSSIAAALPDVRWPPCAGADALTVRSLLTHTHGLNNRGVQWRVAFTGEYTNDQLIDMLADTECLGSTEFRYSNLGYDIFGLVVDRENKGGWKAVVEREVFVPLGMTHTTAWRSSLADDQIAMPHEYGREGIHRISLRKADANLGPAGGHFSTAADLGRLLIAELNDGRIDGEQAIEAASIRATHHPWVEQDREFIIYDRHHWGLGWDIGDYDGETVYHRPGGFAGYYANAAFLPERGFGVAVVANGGAVSASLAETIAAAIYDELRDHPDTEARLEARLEDLRARLAEIASRDPEAVPDLSDAPAHAWDFYVGRYSHPTWGTVTVTRSPEGLGVQMGPMEGTLAPVRGEPDAFYTRMLGNGRVVEFTGDDPGAASVLRFRGESEEYRRVPE